MELFQQYPDMLTVEQMAQALNIGRTKAYQMVRSGAVASLSFGKAIRIPKTALWAVVPRTKECAGVDCPKGGAFA